MDALRVDAKIRPADCRLLTPVHQSLDRMLLKSAQNVRKTLLGFLSSICGSLSKSSLGPEPQLLPSLFGNRGDAPTVVLLFTCPESAPGDTSEDNPYSEYDLPLHGKISGSQNQYLAMILSHVSNCSSCGTSLCYRRHS